MIVRHSYISAKKQPRIAGKTGNVIALGKALAHLKYIQHRPGEDREKGGRELFDGENDNMDPKEFRKALREMKNANVLTHKLTLAPEINPGDRKALARDVMAKLSSEKGQDLRWIAVGHGNTDNHHLHLMVLGKDKSGKDVRLDVRDYDKAKEYGRQYLERVHPLEMERYNSVKEEKERKRVAERKREKDLALQERIRDGLELPWMHKKIIREQLDPYDKWKEKQLEKERAKKDRPSAPDLDAPEKPLFQDTISAAGKEWSKANSLKELRDLNAHLWDNYDDRIPVDEYKKLVAWMKDKERYGERDRQQSPEKAVGPEKEKDHFEYKGEKYDKDTAPEKLFELTAKLREKGNEKLPIEDYQKLRGWMEHADRARWSGVLERELANTHKQFERSKTMEQLKAQEGGRVINPMQENFMSHPVMGLFMQGASIANELVKWIPLDDRNRDFMKEGREALDAAKADKLQEHVQPGRTEEQKERDKASLEKLDQALEQNQVGRDKINEGKKRKKWERDDEESWDKYDPWGRY